MSDLIDNTANEFSSAELVLVAEQVGLAPISRWGNRRLVDAIRLRLRTTGIPDAPPEEKVLTRGEELLEDFLYVAGYVDEDGNQTETGGSDNVGTLEEFMAKHNIKAVPPCFGFADDADPACSKCMLYIHCAQDRLANLPPCYALMWDGNQQECKDCLEAAMCKLTMKQEN